jgi:uncharacterized protein
MPDQPSRTRRRIDYLGGAARAARTDPAAATPARAADPPGPDLRFPGWTREGELLYRRRLCFPGWATEAWPAPWSAGEPEQLLFYDTETTGLSGGAGTVAFLFGAAWCEGPDLAVEQLFLADFPGEPGFLNAVRERMAPYRAFVSYNGRTFDCPLLRTRFTMNGIPWEPGPQVDLLHHARRLWRTVTGDCSLRAMEEHVLGFTRDGDVPGEQVPLIWKEFLRSGSPGLLPAVFEHNAADVASLARLHRAIGRLLAGDEPAARVDEGALGRWMLAGSPEAGTAVLEAAFGRGDAAAGVSLGLHHKRAGRWDQAAAVWESLLSGRSLFAAVELAKHHEHRTHDLARARELMRLALSWNLPLDERRRGELRARAQRLDRKLARAAGGPGGEGPGPAAPGPALP